jgi:predicted DNA-binding mobile mystery protein A
MYHCNNTFSYIVPAWSSKMSLKKTVRKQYQSIVNEAAIAKVEDLKQPAEGWISGVRKALGMSLADLGKRVNKTRSTVSSIERSEKGGRATIQSMNTLAEGMGCKFVYAIIPPDGDIEEVMMAHARKKARALVNQASTHMALEKQSLSAETINDEIERITCDLMESINSDFWKDEK